MRLQAELQISSSEGGEIRKTQAPPERRGDCSDVIVCPIVEARLCTPLKHLLQITKGISTLMFHCSASAAVAAASLFSAPQTDVTHFLSTLQPRSDDDIKMKVKV